MSAVDGGPAALVGEAAVALRAALADASGAVLQAAGDAAAGGTVTNRNLRMTRDFESVLATDVERLLDSAIGAGMATVVVRADLDFDELATETEQLVGYIRDGR